MPLTKLPILGLVVPCFNEEKVLPETIHRLETLLGGLIQSGKIDAKSFLYFVDDGSSDATWQILSDALNSSANIKGIRFSKNFGHQNAVLAGLMSSKIYHPDCLISIDADLQQDENLIPVFLEKYQAGADIVFGIRNDRKSDGFFKKHTALFFYRLMQAMGVAVIPNHADYRLISSKVLETLREYKEVHLFLRGILADMGFRRDYVHFDVKERFAGDSKYSLKKMLTLALDGITSFSVVPLRLVGVVGFVILLFSLAMSCYVLYQRIIGGHAVEGWASTLLPIYFIGGVQIFCVGVLGEYIGKIYDEVKARPRFIVERELENASDSLQKMTEGLDERCN